MRALRAILDGIPTISIPSAEMSPLIHIRIAPSALESVRKARMGDSGGSTGRKRSHSSVSHPPPQPIVVQPAPGAVAYSSALAGSSSRGSSGAQPVPAAPEWVAARDEQERLLQEIVDLAAENGVLLTTTKRNWAQEMVQHQPSIRICVSSALTRKEVEKAGQVVKSAINKVLGKGKK